MKHDKLIAIMMVAVMTASVCTAVTLSTTPATALTPLTASTLTLDASNLWPFAGAPFLLGGQLTAFNGEQLSNRQIEIWTRLPSQAHGTVLTTATTDAAGFYGIWPLILTAATQPTYYRALFRGDGAFAGSTSALILVQAGVQKTSLTISAPGAPNAVGVVFQFTGRLTDSFGNGMPFRQVQVWYRTDGNIASGKLLAIATTDSLGFWSMTTSNGVAPTYYRAVYAGEPGFASVKAGGFPLLNPEPGLAPDWNAYIG